MPFPLRAVALALLAACTLALGACGGDDSYGDKVPRSTPELTPPAGADALAGNQAGSADGNTADSSSSSSDTTTTDETPSASSGATGTATTPAPAQAQPQQQSSGAGTGGAATPTPTQPEQSSGQGTGGASPGEFSQFCQDNPGACPGN